MPTAPPLLLSEDQIDDLLYLARTNETRELLSTIAGIQATPPHAAAAPTEADIVLSAVDAHTGNNIVHMAAANGHTEVLAALIPAHLPAGADGPHACLGHRNASGNTPLHWACLNGHLDAVKLLVLQGGADPAVRNDAGKDALFEAEVAGHAPVVEWLLAACERLEDALGAGGEERGGGEEGSGGEERGGGGGGAGREGGGGGGEGEGKGHGDADGENAC
ncbi:ankyrin repeat-containing domain protein [Tirmania nivea]|nr:ankyrin repeat-containing domain protein [Tirmania nivea]